MPPQSNEMDCGCHQDDSPTKPLPVYWSSRDDLNFSIETESTSSTEIDSSFSKDSLSSVDDDEIETPTNVRSRFFRSADGDERGHEVWLLNDSINYERPQKRRMKRSSRFLRLYRVLVSIAACFSLAAIKSSLSVSVQHETWNRFLQDDAQRIQQEIRTGSTGKDFTILLRGSRLDLLQQSLETHSRCASVNEIQVQFEGFERLPETVLAHPSGKVVPSNTISTEGVFLLSDDVLLSCEELEKGKESKGCVRPRCKRCFAHSFTLPSTAFQTWRTDPSRLVGFFGFRPTGSEKSSRSAANPEIGLEPVPIGSGPYSLVSDRAVFVHRLYLDSIPSRKDLSCCQVLLSLQVSAASAKSPVVMRANPRELLDSNSMSSLLRGGHDISDCSSSCITEWSRSSGMDGLRDESANILG
jgi:hypothetical protein